VTETPIAAAVMAAGLGTRMKSALPKHLHPVLGRRMVDWVLAAAREVGADPIVVIASPSTKDAFDGDTVELAIQEEPRGTGDAIRSARAALEGHAGDVLILSGDTPALTSALLGDLVQTHRREQAAATVLTFVPPDVRSYGRVLRDAGGRVRAIVEAADASPEELEVDEVNSSIYVVRAERLWPALERLEPQNAQGELYLTDAVRLLVEDGESVAAHVAADPREAEGVNTRAELADAAAVLRGRINERHLLAGVTMVDPATTWIEPGVELEPDVTIHPFVYLRGATRVGGDAVIHSHTVAVDAEIGSGATVGPFCYLRPGTVLGVGSKAGTFVEIKNSRIGMRTKVTHLSYVGDAEVGENSNLGAGTITANFPHEPGKPKGRTTIGKNVRTGIQNGLVAPVEVGDGAWIAAGSVITRDVPPGALAVARSRQENKEGYAARHRDD
jgi:bifunctional UDP-N-acetylglucosamine pyrophosphorylase/glucosamine-1-phosphate N-acetyltransferase